MNKTTATIAEGWLAIGRMFAALSGGLSADLADKEEIDK